MQEETEQQPQEEATPAAEAAPVGPTPEARIAELEAALATAKDEHLRALAEVENTRRRGEKQAQDARVYAIDRFAGDLLPVADTLSRALETMPPETRAALDDATRLVLDGVAMTERALLDAFGRHNLRRIGARGDKFDPNLHQAVAQIPSEAPAGAIAEVMQPGYVLGDRTLRAAMVAVSLGQSATAPPAAEGGVDIKV